MILFYKKNKAKKYLKYPIEKIIIVVVGILIASCNNTDESNKKAINFDKLISCEETLSIIKQNPTNYKIIDIRPIQEYNKGHIPNAINTWRPEYENKNGKIKGLMANKDQMELLLQKWGILENDTLILYDGNGNSNSCRLWWILKQYGFDNVKILNGSFISWKQMNYPLDNFVPKTKISRISLNDLRLKNYANITDVQNHIIENRTLLDSRTLEEFDGKIKKANVERAGHIPNAIRLDWSELVEIGTGGNGTFKDINSIRGKLERIHVAEDDDIIVYCESGVRSACVTFVLSEILGYTKVRNYDGSWREWANTDLEIE